MKTIIYKYSCPWFDTDLFGIANPESEMMKPDKLSPYGLKGNQKQNCSFISFF